MQAIHEDDQLQEEEEEVTVPCPSLLVNLPSSAAALVWAALEDERGAREVLLRKTSKQVSRAWAKHITFTKVGRSVWFTWHVGPSAAGWVQTRVPCKCPRRRCWCHQTLTCAPALRRCRPPRSRAYAARPSGEPPQAAQN